MPRRRVSSYEQHEANRFLRMTTAQLAVRLRKITDPLKLEAFAQMAHRYYREGLGVAYAGLYDEAMLRRYGPPADWGSLPPNPQYQVLDPIPIINTIRETMRVALSEPPDELKIRVVRFKKKGELKLCE